MNNSSILYQIALTQLAGIGPIHAKNLIAHCGSPEAVFREKKNILSKVPGVGTNLIKGINKAQALKRAEEEITFIKKNNIKTHYFLDNNYPQRLKSCDDSPIILYSLGETDFNTQKVIGIVGTRNATPNGIQTCEQIIADLHDHQPLIVSGLAYGIDICAHNAAMFNEIQTVGVLGHGLDRIYPHAHRKAASKMVGNGGLLTEFVSQTSPDRENFPKRNRIVAGMCDAILVIESKNTGGSIITAKIAASYNRDVFAIPGRITDPYAQGCNYLIKSHKAAMIEGVKDIEYQLGWEKDSKVKITQGSLFDNLAPNEMKVVELLRDKGDLGIDFLTNQTNLASSEISMLLLNLEFSGKVRMLPGKVYALNSR